jgi:Helix-turn-helix.
MMQVLRKISEEFIKMEVHERIRFLRKQNNFTIKEAAEKSITTEKCWSDWERGKAIPRDKNKKIIASVLGVEQRIIFGELQKFDESKIEGLKEIIKYAKNEENFIVVME